LAKKGQEMSREQMEVARIRMPRKGEVLGIIEQMLGADRLRVRCEDGHTRICRIPGRLRKRVWMHPGDLVLVKPWIVQTDVRADIAYRYTSTQANWLKRKGHVKLDLEF
jgi:translation initiation factor 1A